MLPKAKFLLIVAALAVMGACKEDDSPDEEVVGGCEVALDGGPYDNSKYTTDETAMPVYIAEQDMNMISFYGEANGAEVLVRIMYPGKSPQRLTWTEETCYVATTQVINGEIVEGGHVREFDPLVLHSGYVDVLRYDEKAGIIKGEFGGDFSFIKTCVPEPCIEFGTIEGSFTASMF